jgi:hypothetical protein
MFECRLASDPARIIGTVCVLEGPIDVVVQVADHAFEPEMVYPRPFDRVWWRWEGCHRSHSIQQSHSIDHREQR